MNSSNVIASFRQQNEVHGVSNKLLANSRSPPVPHFKRSFCGFGWMECELFAPTRIPLVDALKEEAIQDEREEVDCAEEQRDGYKDEIRGAPASCCCSKELFLHNCRHHSLPFSKLGFNLAIFSSFTLRSSTRHKWPMQAEVRNVGLANCVCQQRARMSAPPPTACLRRALPPSP